MNSFVNLTPHAITVVGHDPIPPSGQVARLAAETVPVDEVQGIPVVRTQFGEVTGLPEARTNTYLIVSALVRGSLPGRKDLLSPGDLVRDEAGAVIGCRNLICN